MGDLTGTRVLLIEGFARQVMPMMKALRALGCHITTFNAGRLDMGYTSRYPDRKLLSFCHRSDPQRTLAAIEEALRAHTYDVVIPLTDFVAILLAQHKAQLSQYARIAVNDWDVFQKASDKQQTMQVCMAHEVPCPHTLVDVTRVEDITSSGLSYPLVIKPRTGYGSIGFHRIDRPEELDALFPQAVAQHGPMLVQEYIPQTDVQYKAQFFIDAHGDVKNAVVFNKTRWFPIDGGSTCCSVTVDRPDIVRDCTRLLQNMGWRGYADVDLIQDPRDGVAKVMEINPRITACVKICFDAGTDFARQILEHALGREVTPYRDYTKGVCLRYMHTDVLWFLQSPDRFRAKPSWFSFARTTDQIFAWDDPLPWVTYSLAGVMKLVPEMKKRKRR